MGSRVIQHLAFLLYLVLSSGSIVAEKPPPEAVHELVGNQEKQMFFSSSVSTTQFDTTPGTLPLVNPTPPGTTPGVNPTPPTPIITGPIITPPTPMTMTPPTMTPPTTTPASSGGSWCIASPNASPTALQVALDYACGYGGADCSPIQTGASCYNPNTLRDHTSYAFNNYYQKHQSPTSCVFGGTAQLTNTDPSSGSCHYASSPTTPSITPPSITAPQPPSISSPANPTPTMTPPFTTTPGGQTVYGVPEPTGLPSSAINVSFACRIDNEMLSPGFILTLTSIAVLIQISP
ncbi:PLASMODESMATA CALLOSE-BINDING PROTEIN 3-like [Tripterygium wilfordii]|uniref:PLASMODESMATA CALLOSE-BINDING PROTEIN 3-like n=1 Tax=Tripterygium wilfordii TaxID=458696 RepID=UPI0018F81E06|nr:PLASMODESMATA CALLOSE-BINDING PROTEIN 3-like [Tripterygium wilfordii]